MKVNERIKNRRLECGLSVVEVAGALGVSRATIYRYESDEIENMGIDKLIPLAKVLRTTPEYLMGWTTEATIQSSVEPEQDDENLVVLNRAAKKMTPEKRKKLLEMARVMFAEDFDEND